MVRKEHAFARRVHDPRRARDVADPAGTLETVGVGVDERIEACDGRRLLRPSPAVCGEECFQFAAVHWTGRRGAVLALMRIIDHPNREYDGNVRVSGRSCAIDSSPCLVRLGTFVRGSPSLTSAAQPPDERPHLDVVDVQDVLGEVSTNDPIRRLRPQVVDRSSAERANTPRGQCW